MGDNRKGKPFIMTMDELLDVTGLMSEREQKIFAQLYGIGRWKKKTHAELANEYGVSVERIKKIEQRALKLLQQPTRRR